MAEERPPIPAKIKRKVRQRCGFGCVVCGNPFCDYDHMEEWAILQRHRASEITLLCKQHHGEKTNGLLPLEQVLEANRDPHNRRKGVSSPLKFHFRGRDC